tara:strand:- start:666 stop:1460 length:795 start_codon:yes stop_codon:yes gene_type:complete
MNKISVIIPSFKFKDLLIESLISIKLQKIKPYEILIISTKKILKKEKNKICEIFGNIKFHNNIAGNASQNRNVGAKKAKGNYLAFLDDDDIWHNNYLKEINKTIKKNPDAVFTWLNKIKHKRISKFKSLNEDITSSDLFDYNPGIIGSNIVIKKKIFLDLKGFDPKLRSSEDKDFLIRFLDKKYSFEILKKRYVYHRQLNTKQLSFDLEGKIYFLKKYAHRMSKKSFFLYKRKLILLNIKNVNIFKKLLYYLSYVYIQILYKNS